MQNYDPSNLELHGKLKAICITLKEIIEIVKEIDGQILDKQRKIVQLTKELMRQQISKSISRNV